MKDTQVGGHQHERGLCGDPGADRTAGADARDPEYAAHNEVMTLVSQLLIAYRADRDHAREERDTLEAKVRSREMHIQQLIDEREESSARDEDRVERLNANAVEMIACIEKLSADLAAAREELATLKDAGRCLGCRADLHDGAGTCAPCAASDALVYQTETATLREELATLKADLHTKNTTLHAMLAEAEAANSRLQPYVQHLLTCDMSVGLVRDAFGFHTRGESDPPAACTCGLVPR